MTTLSKHTITVILFIFSMIIHSQNVLIPQEQVFSFEEFLGYVKQQHPLIKQAELILSTGEASVLKARGGFDPKIELDYSGKRFKDIEYYDELSTTFKIPTWYGVEFKANFEQNSGEFLNPRLDVPDEGLYSFGVSLALAQGFLINERMATLRKAKFFREQTIADRDLLVNNLLFEASKTYFEWLQANNEERIYKTFLENASVRLKAVERSVQVGEKPEIDITEARIAFQNRKLNLEAASLKARKAALIVSNYLWLDNIPVELQDYVVPQKPEISILERSLQIEGITNTEAFLENHPKLQSLDAKISSLTVDKSLKRNKLLPKIGVEYNFISSDAGNINSYNNQEYKAGLKVSYPIFSRKQRGDLRLAKQKLQDANYERTSTVLNLQNKISAVNAEINSLLTQNELINNIVIDYETLVKAEERKFFLGESSLFLINLREQKLIDSQLKQNKLTIKQLKAIANLYNALGVR
ncbi:TolC family protein [Flavobacteriaceae bacterium AU392]|nr:TolC family protein [Flavobacteriaceae bacterium]RKM85904.1 TolC family protein [Flavobacteriaceae bacterium AU392]